MDKGKLYLYNLKDFDNISSGNTGKHLDISVNGVNNSLSDRCLKPSRKDFGNLMKSNEPWEKFCDKFINNISKSEIHGILYTLDHGSDVYLYDSHCIKSHKFIIGEIFYLLGYDVIFSYKNKNYLYAKDLYRIVDEEWKIDFSLLKMKEVDIK